MAPLAGIQQLRPTFSIQHPLKAFEMKALQLEQVQSWKLIDIPAPRNPGAGEAIVRVHRVGVCGPMSHATSASSHSLLSLGSPGMNWELKSSRSVPGSNICKLGIDAVSSRISIAANATPANADTPTAVNSIKPLGSCATED